MMSDNTKYLKYVSHHIYLHHHIGKIHNQLTSLRFQKSEVSKAAFEWTDFRNNFFLQNVFLGRPLSGADLGFSFGGGREFWKLCSQLYASEARSKYSWGPGGAVSPPETNEN